VSNGFVCVRVCFENGAYALVWNRCVKQSEVIVSYLGLERGSGLERGRKRSKRRRSRRIQLYVLFSKERGFRVCVYRSK